MNIRNNISLLFLITLSSLYAQDTSFHGMGMQRTELESSQKIGDVLRLSDEAWTEDSRESAAEEGRDLWLKASLPPVTEESQQYLTENKGIRIWDFYLTEEDLLVEQDVVDWSLPYRNKVKNGAQFRGLTYASFRQSPGKDYTVYIHISNTNLAKYNFILSSAENFTSRQQSWSLIQGMGLGYMFMIVILSLILVLKMKYRINWLFLFLVLASGVSIFYVSGLGPYIVAGIFPGYSQHFWYVLLGLFSPVVILYIRSFIPETSELGKVRLYFKVLLGVSLTLAAVPLFVSSDRVFIFVNIQSLITYVLIGAGLIKMSLQRVKPAMWMLTGWLFNILVNVMGYFLASAYDRSTHTTIVFHLLSQGILSLLFGGAMILDMEEKFKKESSRREHAETLARNAVERMSSNERMADLGRMVASVTHELGNPLGVAVTLSTSLESKSKRVYELFENSDLDEEEFQEFIKDVKLSSDLIYRNMEQARTLINGFKVVASDQVVPDIRTFDLSGYTDMLQKVFSPVLRRAGCLLEVSVLPGLTITSIPGILTQVVSNLVNNALKHGMDGKDKGRIIIRCSREEDRIILSVEDNGHGIPLDIQDKIFDIYFTTKKGRGGTGIGLSIVKTLVEEELKGSIHFVSKPGTGAVFTVSLPENILEN